MRLRARPPNGALRSELCFSTQRAQAASQRRRLGPARPEPPPGQQLSAWAVVALRDAGPRVPRRLCPRRRRCCCSIGFRPEVGDCCTAATLTAVSRSTFSFLTYDSSRNLQLLDRTAGVKRPVITAATGASLTSLPRIHGPRCRNFLEPHAMHSAAEVGRAAANRSCRRS